MSKKKKKSPLNQTIDFNLEEGTPYIKRCIDLKAFDKELLTETNKTIIGDFFEAIQIIPNESVDLLIVDPPYNLTKEYHGNRYAKTTSEKYHIYTEEWIVALKEKLKPTGTIYVCCDWCSSLIIGVELMKHFNVRNRITWQREKGRGAKTNWKNSIEDIWYATQSNEFTFNLDAVKERRQVLAPYRVEGEPKDWEETSKGKFRDTCPSNFWNDITIPFWSMPENTAHPTQKPEKLIAKLILASSNEGDVVLDPFLGSGTTSVVAKKLNRQYIGIEQNPLYCAWAEKRLEIADEDNSIQGYTDGVFWERNTLAFQKQK